MSDIPSNPAPDLHEKPSTHVAALDGVRGVAILVVLALHLLGGDQRSIPGLDAIYRLSDSGWVGVDLFFVLSGFLITGILVDAKGSETYFRNFYARRFLRIFPLYYGLILLGWFVSRYVVNADPANPLGFRANQIWLWTFLVNFRDVQVNTLPALAAGKVIYPHFWTLAVEEQFYVVWPLIVFLLPLKWLLNACYFIVVAVLVARSGYYMTAHNGFVTYVSTQYRIDSLVWGAIAALAFRSGRVRELVRNNVNRILVLATLGVLVVILFDQAKVLQVDAWQTASGNGVASGPMPSRYSAFVATAGYSVLGVAFASILLGTVLAHPGHVARRVLEVRWLRLIGKYSYGIYAIHMSIIVLVREPTTKWAYHAVHSRTAADAIGGVTALVLSLLAAYLSYHAYEMPFLRLKRFFPTPHPRLK